MSSGSSLIARAGGIVSFLFVGGTLHRQIPTVPNTLNYRPWDSMQHFLQFKLGCHALLIAAGLLALQTAPTVRVDTVTMTPMVEKI